MATFVALFRGINVGKAKRVPMAGLRDLLGGLGYGSVATLLNSGNAVFTARGGALAQGERIRAAVLKAFGVDAPVVVLDGEDFLAILAGNPLPLAGRDPSRLLVAFTQDPGTLAELRPLAEAAWAPDELAVGARAAYLGCAEGVLASKLFEAVNRRLGDRVTTRNWATVEKLGQLLAAPRG